MSPPTDHERLRPRQIALEGPRMLPRHMGGKADMGDDAPPHGFIGPPALSHPRRTSWARPTQIIA